MKKNISFQSGRLLLEIGATVGKPWFTVKDAATVMESMKIGALRQLLNDMVKRGLLMTIKNGIYYPIPYTEDPELFMPDWHTLAEPLVGGANYYIGYYSALQIHGLITQPSLNEYIVTDRQIKPAVTKIKNVAFQFIYYNKKHFFGQTKIWLNDYERVSCSDLEKTIIDCLYEPEYRGGIVEIGKALYSSKLNLKRLLEYCKKFGSQSVIKRLGFLLELFDIGGEIIPSLLELKASSNVWIVLDTELPKTGMLNKKWSILQNIDTDTILNAHTT